MKRKNEDMITEGCYTFKEATGQDLLTIEDITNYIRESLLRNFTPASKIECSYCGDEVQYESDVQEDEAKLHPTQINKQ